MKSRDWIKNAFLDNGELDYEHVNAYNGKSNTFFGTGKGVGNPTDTRNMAKSNCIEGLFKFNHLIKNSQYLESREDKWVDQVFNAHTMETTLFNLLREKNQPEVLKKFRHDFKTIELARMYFEVSMQFLKELTKDSQLLHNEIDNISKLFKDKASTILQNEVYKEHGNEDDKALTRKQEKELEDEFELVQKKQRKHFNSKEYEESHKAIQELEMKSIKLKNEIMKENKYESLSKKQLEQLSKKQAELEKQSDLIRTPLIEKEIEFSRKLYEISKKLNKKYDSVKNYYCKINFLDVFSNDMLDKNFYLSENKKQEIINKNKHKSETISPSILSSVKTV